MSLKPSPTLTSEQVNTGLSFVTRDGCFTEAMVALTGGTFLTAMAIQMGASNLQIGLLAALPTLSNILQLASIWLVQRFRNRRAISVICSLFARIPLLIIGILPFIVSAGTTVNALIFLLFFHYALGSIVGASWNSWMKDLVPENRLGNYFSYRTRVTSTINLVLSIATAFAIDFIKNKYPQWEAATYPAMFLLGGIFGMISVWMMGLTPEPTAHIEQEHLLKKIKKPFRDKNFRNLLVFNSAWTFSLNLATPFFSVFLLRSVHVSISMVILLNIVSQVSSILAVRVWGNYTDRFSNKTVIRICAPAYIACILCWSLVGANAFTIPFLVFIFVLTGIATSGINLALNNIGLKLADKKDAIVYIAARNMTNAFIPALAPIFAGIFADYLMAHHVISNWKVFFVASAVLAALSLKLLTVVKEEGEVQKETVVKYMMSSVRLSSMKKQFAPVKALHVFNIFSREKRA